MVNKYPNAAKPSHRKNLNFVALLIVVCVVGVVLSWTPESTAEKPFALDRQASDLEMVLPIHLKIQPDTKGFSVCGIQPGMMPAEVRALLGEPKSEGAENPLREEGGGGYEVQWWMNYEEQCRTGSHPKCHSWPHVGFDQRDGTVVYVVGSTVEEDREPRLWQGSTFDEITNLLGEYKGSSSDACYFYFESIFVRGCDQT